MKTTAREYLVTLGLAKAGRGKFSNAGKAALVEAVEAGVEFSDYTIEGKAKEASYETAPKTWPEDATAMFITSQKNVSMTNACNACGYSLHWCDCPQPRVYGKAVRISAR